MLANESLLFHSGSKEGIAIQPVYYDLDDPNPSMPVSYPRNSAIFIGLYHESSSIANFVPDL